MIEAAGMVRDIDAKPGESLMENAKAHGIDSIVAECGGSMVCGTCHVHIPEPWIARLEPPSAMERDMLECVMHPAPNARLSCQIIVTPELDGMEVIVPPSQR